MDLSPPSMRPRAHSSGLPLPRRGFSISPPRQPLPITSFMLVQRMASSMPSVPRDVGIPRVPLFGQPPLPVQSNLRQQSLMVWSTSVPLIAISMPSMLPKGCLSGLLPSVKEAVASPRQPLPMAWSILARMIIIYVFNASGCGRSSCSPLWSYRAGAEIESSPVVANGVVYVGSPDGKLYSFIDLSAPGSQFRTLSGNL